jgi:cbb3-type cytochrome oxidase subunit 1
MHKRNRLFIATALAYGLAGGLLALVQLVHPGLVPGDVQRAHAHMMLLGFVLMMIYGVGLHVIPRFGGHPLRSEHIASWQFWLANTGLPLMVVGWLAQTAWLVRLGGMASVAAMALFGLNVIGTVRLKSPLET